MLAEVDADDLVGAAVDVEQNRRLARPGGFALAQFDDEAFVQEFRNQVGYRDAREAGLAGDVRPASLTGAVERLQHERAVVARVRARGGPSTFGRSARPGAMPVASCAWEVSSVEVPRSDAVMFVSKAYEQNIRKLSTPILPVFTNS